MMRPPPAKIHLSLVILLILGMESSLLLSQKREDYPGSIHISMGSTHSRLVDELLTERKLKFAGTVFSTQAIYQKTYSTYRLHGLVNVGNGSLKNRLTDLPIRFIHLRVLFSYQRPISKHSLFGKKGKLWLGPQIGLSDYVLYNEKVLENITLTFNNTLNVLAVQELAITDNQALSLAVSLPIFGFRKREAYDGGANTQLEEELTSNIVGLFFQRSKPHFFHPLVLPRVNLFYRFGTQKRTKWVLNYQFHFLQNQQESPVVLYENSLLFGLRFHL